MVVPCEEVDVGDDEDGRRDSNGPVVDVVAHVTTAWVRVVEHHHLQTGQRTDFSIPMCMMTSIENDTFYRCCYFFQNIKYAKTMSVSKTVSFCCVKIIEHFSFI